MNKFLLLFILLLPSVSFAQTDRISETWNSSIAGANPQYYSKAIGRYIYRSMAVASNTSTYYIGNTHGAYGYSLEYNSGTGGVGLVYDIGFIDPKSTSIIWKEVGTIFSNKTSSETDDFTFSIPAPYVRYRSQLTGTANYSIIIWAN